MNESKERELFRRKWSKRIGRTLGIVIGAILLWQIYSPETPQKLYTFALALGFAIPIVWMIPNPLTKSDDSPSDDHE